MAQAHCELFPACLELGENHQIPKCNKERCPGTANKTWHSIFQQTGAGQLGPAPILEALKDTIATCYGLLWEVHTADKRVHTARRKLLHWLTKEDQARGIEMARTSALNAEHQERGK